MIDTRWPELFLVGAPRAGTTSLWDYLDQHPQIFMSRLKEPHFFGNVKPRFVPAVSNEDAYLRLFERARPGQLRGEASPSYLANPAAPAAIARVRPDARILIVLRDPVARAYSDFWHKVRYGRGKHSFLDAIRVQLADPLARTPGGGYVRAGVYAEAVERYVNSFDGRVLVLFLEELAADTRRELRRIFACLGVEPNVAERVQLRVRNATSLPRNALVRRAYGSVRLRELGRHVVPDSLHPALERVLLQRDGVPPMEPEARRLLEEFYAPQVPALERLVGRPPPWARRAGATGVPVV